MYSLKKNFKGKKNINTKKRTVVIKRKKSGKYYVKVRAYKKLVRNMYMEIIQRE